ncbi:MAG TPA: hypothetical protein VGF67_18155 [Ktedonobacteraceae bacterium]|jgi:hypothetical protein
MSDSSFKKPVSPENEAASSVFVHTILLERYRFLLFKEIALLLLNRVISFLILGFVAISMRLSLLQLFAVVLVSGAVTIIWLDERRRERSQAQTLADDLAQQSKKEDLDFYIRSRYNVDRKTSTRSILSLALYEPQMWFILTIAFAILQYTSGPFFLH